MSKQITLEESVVMNVLEQIADRLLFMHTHNKQEFAELHRKLAALQAMHADDTEALREMVAAGPVVVPNEDEAAPVVDEKTVLASCPVCKHTVYDEYDVEQDFGYRTPTGRDTIVQSWCRKCRTLEQVTSPRKKQRLPDHIRFLGVRFRELDKKADAKAAERAKVLEASNGRETKESTNLLIEQTEMRAEARKLQQEYDKERRPLSESRNTK